MICAACKTSNAPHELRDGKCLACIHKENGQLREALRAARHRLLNYEAMAVRAWVRNVIDPLVDGVKTETTNSAKA